VHLLEQSDAVQLFVQRAQAAQPGFALDTGTAAGVVAICHRLDGLPLPIELAAARLNVLPVDDLLTRLEGRFRLLRRGRSASTDRHQSLQATMNSSYELLDPAAQAVLRRLAVFAGGWNLAEAETGCAGENVEADAVLDLLDELLDRSLLYVYEAGGLSQYGMLEMARQYGLQQLQQAGERTVVQDRHLALCVTLAEQAAPALQRPEQMAWLARLAR
jgi:predicted ATPase